MIHRTVSEWGILPYGDDERDQRSIPTWVAERLLAAAERSPMAGWSGSRVLQRGRSGLRAGGLVGVVVALGCSIEILPKIDASEPVNGEEQGRLRESLVHMLAVAHDVEVAGGGLAALGWQREGLLEAIVRLFLDTVENAAQHGLPRAYRPIDEDLPTLRGRLRPVRQFTALATSHAVLACRYDALSYDTPIGRVLKAALDALTGLAREASTRRRVERLLVALADVPRVQPRDLPWGEVLVDRTTAPWATPLRLARLLLQGRYQTTSRGEEQGFALLFEMSDLFESYMTRLVRRALAPRGLAVEAQAGRQRCLTLLDAGGAPMSGLFYTRPDMILRRPSGIVAIIDTKWKRLVPAHEDKKQGVSQTDVYQMMAYARVYECRKLVLLYPRHDGLGAQAGVVGRHRIVEGPQTLDFATFDVRHPEHHRARVNALMDELLIN